jgi:hypothetical protein
VFCYAFGVGDLHAVFQGCLKNIFKIHPKTAITDRYIDVELAARVKSARKNAWIMCYFWLINRQKGKGKVLTPKILVFDLQRGIA